MYQVRTQENLIKGAFDLEFEIRISDLQSNAKSENGFQRCDIWFWISFLPFDWEIRKRIWKTVLKGAMSAGEHAL